jgi:hypothetical protein
VRTSRSRFIPYHQKTTAVDLLRVLECGAPRCVCQQSVERGRGLTHCPAHDDEHPSLSVSDRNGSVLWHCHAGCPQGLVTAALLEKLGGRRDRP